MADDVHAGGLVRQDSRAVDGPADLDVGVDVGRVDVYLEDPAPRDGSETSGGTTGNGAEAGSPEPTGPESDSPESDRPGPAGPESDSPGPDGAAATTGPADASPRSGQQVRVEVRHDPAATGGWAQRLGEVASWLGAVGAGPDASPDAAAGGADAVRAAEISWSTAEPGSGSTRLTVRSTSELPLRMVPLVVTVWAPAGSRVAARTGAGDVTIHGRAGRATVRTGAGTAGVGDVTGEADITTGSGDVAVGAVGGRARIRTGSGAVHLAAVGGTTDVKAGSGDVTLGEVAADVGVRTGTGAVHVADARSGRVELTSGSGGLRIGVHAGVLAELDLSSGSGWARSELDVQRTAPAREPELRLRGRTASGDVLVTRAAAPA
jgi:hypothetical protein